ncbi:8-oxo-dGTP diphosphatase MutT [Glaciecola siphonariae]|uniref:8-oxo-dGTP diphosphatase n=1 Tax=Glaciecola siphonariae TaxID=521012 RepID=A0ABV9LVW5_9ALTE
MKHIDVAVGVVLSSENERHNQDRHFFICKRSAKQHQGDKWEFPGGKVDAGETPEQALARELTEEINIDVKSCEALMQIRHDYVDKQVCLHVFLVTEFTGQARGAEGQESKWVSGAELANYEFPDANQAILHTLAQKGLCT